jgi:hypothetical protein
MGPQILKESQIPTSASDVFAIVQQLASQLHESRMREVVDAVKDLDLKDSQLMVNLLSTVRCEPSSLGAYSVFFLKGS